MELPDVATAEHIVMFASEELREILYLANYKSTEAPVSHRGDIRISNTIYRGCLAHSSARLLLLPLLVVGYPATFERDASVKPEYIDPLFHLITAQRTAASARSSRTSLLVCIPAHVVSENVAKAARAAGKRTLCTSGE